MTPNIDVIFFIEKARTSVSVMFNSVSRQKSICMLSKHLFSRAHILFSIASILHFYHFQIITALTETLLYFITQQNKITFRWLHIKELPSDSLDSLLSLFSTNKQSALWGLESVSVCAVFMHTHAHTHNLKHAFLLRGTRKCAIPYKHKIF